MLLSVSAGGVYQTVHQAIHANRNGLLIGAQNQLWHLRRLVRGTDTRHLRQHTCTRISEQRFGVPLLRHNRWDIHTHLLPDAWSARTTLRSDLNDGIKATTPLARQGQATCITRRVFSERFSPEIKIQIERPMMGGFAFKSHP